MMVDVEQFFQFIIGGFCLLAGVLELGFGYYLHKKGLLPKISPQLFDGTQSDDASQTGQPPGRPPAQPRVGSRPAAKWPPLPLGSVADLGIKLVTVLRVGTPLAVRPRGQPRETSLCWSSGRR